MTAIKFISVYTYTRNRTYINNQTSIIMVVIVLHILIRIVKLNRMQSRKDEGISCKKYKRVLTEIL